MTPQAIHLLNQLLHSENRCELSELSFSLKASESSITELINELENLGCVVIRTGHSIELDQTSLEVWADYLEYYHSEFNLNGLRIGHKIHLYRETASTQDIARRLCERGSDHLIGGQVVVADHQTEGRGRLGRQWNALPGSCLLLTAIIDSRTYPLDHVMLSTCCAVGKTIESFLNKPVQVKWPNDILINRQKISGILVEMEGPMALIGIGLNTFLETKELPDSLKDIVTSLHVHTHVKDRLAVLDRLCHHLNEMLVAPSEDLKAWWYDRSILFEQRVTVECDGRRYTGRVVDLDTEAGLMIAVDHGPVTVFPAATTSLVQE